MPGTIARLLNQLRSLPVGMAVEPAPRLGPIDRIRARHDFVFESRLVSQMGGAALVAFCAQYAASSSGHRYASPCRQRAPATR